VSISIPVPVRWAVLRMPRYVPPQEGRLGKLRLDFNENTAGCSPAVRRALARLSAEKIAMYPEYLSATRRLAKYLGAHPGELLLTNGADDALRVVTDTFVDPGSGVVVIEPTFPMYRFFGELASARIIELRYDAAMRFPLSQVITALRRRPRVLFLANPNNPTGGLVRPSDLRKILAAASRTLVVVDEAYYEFSGHTVLPWIRRYKNLAVVRTFSKAAGLAGLRLGCLLTHPELMAVMRRAATPFPVNAAVLVAAEAAARDRRGISRYVREVRLSRDELGRGLRALGGRTFPSVANFILADFGPRGPRLVKKLESQGILLRDRSDAFRRPGFVRITVGTRSDTHRLLRALKLLC
jgi:histidinol-phosphate aminotransferase